MSFAFAIYLGFPLAFSTVNRSCMAFLYGRAGHLTAQNGGFWPRWQWSRRSPYPRTTRFGPLPTSSSPHTSPYRSPRLPGLSLAQPLAPKPRPPSVHHCPRLPALGPQSSGSSAQGPQGDPAKTTAGHIGVVVRNAGLAMAGNDAGDAIAACQGHGTSNSVQPRRTRSLCVAMVTAGRNIGGWH